MLIRRRRSYKRRSLEDANQWPLKNACKSRSGSSDSGKAAQGEGHVSTNKPASTGELSPRERQILVLIASGKSSKQIAEQLGITFKTVVAHRHNLHKKLKVHKAVDLTRAAIRLGSIDP